VPLQEYLHQLSAASPGAGSEGRPPQLAGAALLASACAGTVMAFGQFVQDAGGQRAIH
jgi:hypothetical protein